MRNPFLRPQTVSQWLLSSICWTGSCLSAWWLACRLLDNVLPQGLGSGSMPVSFCVAHGLIWWRGVRGGNAILRYDEQYLPFSLTRLAARLWFMALGLFQLSCLVGLLFAALLLLADSQTAPHTSSEGFFGG